MGLYWRVRSYTASGEVYNPFDPPETLQKPFSVTYTSTAESEEELVCYRGFEITSGDDGFDDLRFEIYPDYIVPTATRVPVYGTNETLGVFVSCFISQRNEESSSWSSDGEASRVPVNFYAFGEVIPVLLFDNPKLDPPSEGINTLSISAESYWSYGGTYNTSTGLPL